MNLISCDECGVVLDKNKITVPNIYLEDGCIDTNKSVWDGETFVPIVRCPVCDSKVIV